MFDVNCILTNFEKNILSSVIESNSKIFIIISCVELFCLLETFMFFFYIICYQDIRHIIFEGAYFSLYSTNPLTNRPSRQYLEYRIIKCSRCHFNSFQLFYHWISCCFCHITNSLQSLRISGLFSFCLLVVNIIEFQT